MAEAFVEPTDDELKRLERWLVARISYPEQGPRAKENFRLAAKVVDQYRRRFKPCD